MIPVHIIIYLHHFMITIKNPQDPSNLLLLSLWLASVLSFIFVTLYLVCAIYALEALFCFSIDKFDLF